MKTKHIYFFTVLAVLAVLYLYLTKLRKEQYAGYLPYFYNREPPNDLMENNEILRKMFLNRVADEGRIDY